MKCLILGGAGFLGSYLCEYLVSIKSDVYIYESPNADITRLYNVKDHVNIIRGNFKTENDFCYVLEGMDIVYHLICTSVPKTSNENIIMDLEDNVCATLRLLDGCIKCHIGKFIFFSSGGTVYGNMIYDKINEDHPTNPISAYGVQKLAIEKYIQLYSHLYQLDYRILRISNPYGPRQSPFRAQGVIPSFLTSAITERSLEIWGTGQVIRDYIYIDDVISGINAVVNYCGDYKLFNLGSGNGLSILALIEVISTVVKKKLDVIHISGQKQDVVSNVLDISRICNETKWMPMTGITTGIEYMFNTWKATNFVD